MKQPKRERKQKRISSTRASDTKKTTLELYKQGMNIAEIATARNFAPATIENHLSAFITTGELQLSDFVSAKHQRLISEAVTVHGNSSLKVLKDNLPDDVTYTAIKMTLAELEKQNVQ